MGHIERFDMPLSDVIEDRVSHLDAIVIHVFLQRLVILIERREVLMQPAKRQVCHKDILDWWGILNGVCNIPKFHIEGPVRVALDKTAFYHEFVQGVVIVTIPWDGGINKGENLLDAEVAIVEGSAKGKGTDDGPAPPGERIGVGI